MEQRNSRQGNSRRPSSGNSNQGNSFRKSSSTSSSRRPDSRNSGSGKSFNKSDSSKRPDFRKSNSSFGDRDFTKKSGDRTSFGGKSRDNSDRPSFKPRRTEEGSERRTFGRTGDDAKSQRPFGDRKAFGENKRSAEGGEKRSFDRDKKPFDRSDKKPFDRSDKKPFEKSEKTLYTRNAEEKVSEIKTKFVEKKKEEKYTKSDIKTPVYKELDAFRGKTKKTAEQKAEGIRLNRYIANSGVCSRRDADLLITTGEITVNGEIIIELGFKVQATDVVKYSGQTLKREKNVYVLLNKPKDFITTTNDPEDRRTVMDLVSGAAKERLFPVGRLDRNTTGLILLTNDGELAEKLSHPSNKIKKIYQVTLDQPLEDRDLEKIQKGLHLEDGPAEVDDIAIITPDKINLGVEIHIGRNRIVRRIFESLGYNVVKLDRVLYAELTKKDLPRGNWRYLTDTEVAKLKNPGRIR
jgi:23S rRNA pseudouridine2605 synthase